MTRMKYYQPNEYDTQHLNLHNLTDKKSLNYINSLGTGFSNLRQLFHPFFSPLQSNKIFGPRQANLVLIAYASSEGSGEPAHPRSLARTSAARSYRQ